MQVQPETPPKKPVKVIWWKLGLGIFLLLLGIKNLVPVGPSELMPVNAGETAGYYGITIVMLLVGLGFVIAGIKSLWLRTK